MLSEHFNQLLREFFGDIRVAVCDVRNEVDEIAERYYTRFCARRWRRHEDFTVALILVVLGAEVLHIGSVVANCSVTTVKGIHHIQEIASQKVALLRITPYFLLEVGPVKKQVSNLFVSTARKLGQLQALELQTVTLTGQPQPFPTHPISSSPLLL